MLKQITILSGKGGTGKTTLTASFAVLSKNKVLADCDVDAPNLHLLLNPEVVEKQEFKGLKLAVIDGTQCIQCGRCEENCRFDAIKEFTVNPILCEGCAVCAYVCPVDSIRMMERISGYAFISDTQYGPMAHARLNPGEENSGKLVTLVRNNARRIAENKNLNLIINDGPPGIGCPVIASISGIDLGLVIVEPTLSGIHDLERAIGLLDHFRVPALVCINKYDINMKNTQKITDFCESRNLELVGKIPFDPIVTEAIARGEPVVAYSPESMASKSIVDVWKKLNIC